MRTSSFSLQRIAEFEDIHLKAYLDPIGIPTIGVGHTAGVKMGDVITHDQAMKYFAEDIRVAERAVDQTGLQLTQDQYDALVSFTYNCGAGNLKKLVKGRTHEQIARAIPLYNKAGGRVLAGLVRRRAWEQSMFQKGLLGGKSVTDLANEVIDGKWGNGSERKRRLLAAGYDYSAIQKEVNRIIRSK